MRERETKRCQNITSTDHPNAKVVADQEAPNMSPPTLLVIGANGRLGVELIRAASTSPHAPPVHAFLRTPSKLASSDASLCASVVTGDARSAADLERALASTGATVVILSVGVPNSAAPTDLREASAKALLDTVRSQTRFDHVKVVVVSSVGAGGSKLDFGWGVGTFMAWFIRHVLKDHDNRERLFDEWLKGADERNRKRVWIVRPTTLTLGKPKSGVVPYDDGRAPSWWIDRKDLAVWIVEQVCASDEAFGTAVNVTGKN